MSINVQIEKRLKEKRQSAYIRAAECSQLILNTVLGFCLPLHKMLPNLCAAYEGSSQLCSFKFQFKYFCTKYKEINKQYTCEFVCFIIIDDIKPCDSYPLCHTSSSILTENGGKIQKNKKEGG